MVRIGSEEAPLAQRAKDVWVDGLIQAVHLPAPRGAQPEDASSTSERATQLSRTIAEIVTRLADIQDQVSVFP